MALQVVESLLEDLNANQINYCHWKSNEHLDASVHGDTDLDILFDESQKEQVIALLKRNHFNLFEAIWYKKYNGIVDYIGFDKASGKIIHVHTHFHLDLGEVGIKSYHLPWEKLILAHKIFNEAYQIYTASPVVEYLLLVVRTAFKRDRINYRSNRRIIHDFNKEAEWLYSQVATRELKVLAEEVLGTSTAELIVQIRKKEGYDRKLFKALKSFLKPYFADSRVLTASRVAGLKALHLWQSLTLRLEKVAGIHTRRLRRSLPQEGVIVSLMGADGAGKSTQTKLLMKELAKKVDVLFVYMGSGKGDKSRQRKMMDFLFGLGSKLETPTRKEAVKKEGAKEEPEARLSDKSVFKQLVISVMAVSLAYERKTRLKKIEKEKERGGIIICDRYPQTVIEGHNDGMKLQANNRSPHRLLRRLARYEKECYQLSKRVYPDLVVKLIGEVDTLHARRPEMSRAEIEKKQAGIIQLEFGPETEIKRLPIDRPMVEIKGAILDAIGEQISKKQPSKIPTAAPNR